MDVSLMTTPELSMAFSEDQLSVTVSEEQLANGLSLSSSSSTNKNPDLWSQPDIAVISSSTQDAVPTANNASFNSTRFRVDPARADQSIIYHQVQGGSINSQTLHSKTPNSGAISDISRNNSPSMALDSQSVTKSRKKVSFPEGEALIKGFAHAPNPWYNVSFCTTENLVSAYISSCSTHSVRPLSKLLTQLKAITDFGERINLLTLKGEHLNCKHIETLEEIFRRVQFNTVDMEATHLDDESAIALFEMVEYYESVVHLKIPYNKNLGLRAWVAAARMLRRTQHLESIDLKGCSINEQCMTVLGRAIKIGACIHALYLQECNLSGRGVLIIAAALRSISTIKELHIGDNNLQPSDGIQLGNLIRNNTYLHTLDVRNNHLQDIGIAHICDGLAEQPNGIGLKSLNISNTHFSPASINVIAIALSRTKTLNTLNISYNNLTNEGFFALKEGLLKNKSLCRLALRCTKISDEGAVALAEYIADSYTISQLDIRENDIKTAGLLAISMCLKVQETITRLEIDQTVKKEPAVKDYASQQRFFLDELQNKVTQNAELQRAKLERLLVQSQSAKSGAEPAIPVSISEVAKPVETKPSEEPIETEPSDTNLMPLGDAGPDSSTYFDPLGAVSVEDGGVSVEDGAVSVEHGDVSVKDDSVSVEDGAVSVKNGAVFVEDGSVSVEHGDASVKVGGVSVEDGAVFVKNGAVFVKNGAVFVEDGSISAEHGDVSVKDGAISVEGLGVSVEDGGVSVEGGGVSVEDSAVSVENGAVSVQPGDVSVEDGAASVEDGAVSVEDGADASVQNLDSCNIPDLTEQSSLEVEAATSDTDGTGCINSASFSEGQIDNQLVLADLPKIIKTASGLPDNIDADAQDTDLPKVSVNFVNNPGPSKSDANIPEQTLLPTPVNALADCLLDQCLVEQPVPLIEGSQATPTALSSESSENSIITESEVAPASELLLETTTVLKQVNPDLKSSVKEDESSHSLLVSDSSGKPLASDSHANIDSNDQTSSSSMILSTEGEFGDFTTVPSSSCEVESMEIGNDKNMASPLIPDVSTSSKGFVQSVVSNDIIGCPLPTGENTISDLINDSEGTCQEVPVGVDNDTRQSAESTEGTCPSKTSNEHACQSLDDSSACTEQSLVDIDNGPLKSEDIFCLDLAPTDSHSTFTPSAALHTGSATETESRKASSELPT